ncbi:hypothetical protein [Chromobacterium subtsugae]|uniref:hypothetical protein n=1 Tax=Chromobacterium subtsugae TaxID=251747 RepID=UPI00128B85EE|nr:hypothetical protein [Chromobacterium subtsugae]
MLHSADDAAIPARTAANHAASGGPAPRPGCICASSVVHHCNSALQQGFARLHPDFCKGKNKKISENKDGGLEKKTPSIVVLRANPSFQVIQPLHGSYGSMIDNAGDSLNSLPMRAARRARRADSTQRKEAVARTWHYRCRRRRTPTARGNESRRADARRSVSGSMPIAST